jgi:glutaminyl-tRNA synthetase
LKVIIDNYPEGAVEELEAINNPEDPAAGTRGVPFARELYIEQDDFRETPPPKYYRLFPGNEVRLRYAYYITCTHVEKDTQGNVIAVHCTYDPATRGGQSPDNRKVKSTIHWVAAAHALDAEVRLYDRLFTQENPTAAMDGGDVVGCVNPASLDVVSGCKVEPSLGQARPGACFQFERLGYFCVDSEDAQPGALVFNRAVTLKDTWAKIEKAGR